MIQPGKPILKVYQSLKIISQIESFPYPEKQGTPKEGQRIPRLKHCVKTKNNKDEDNSPKNNTQNIPNTNNLHTDLFDLSIGL